MKAKAHHNGSPRKAIENGPGVWPGDEEACAGPDNIDAAVGHNPYPFVLRSGEVVHPDASNMLPQRRVWRPLAVAASEL
jgi:hypothetical protein